MEAVTSAGLEHLLVIRLSMLREPQSEGPGGVPASSDTDGAAPAQMKNIVRSLDASARRAIMELRQGDKVYGQWPFTARDLNVSFDPEALVGLQERFGGVLPALNGLAARGAQSLSSAFPTIVTLNRLDSLRQALSWDPSLPLVISKPLRMALDVLDPDRRVVWLELAEPLGFLPLLPWERVLRPAVNAPILRHSRKPLHGLRRPGTLDVLLACSSRTENQVVPPKAMAAMCRQILAALPDSSRCVIHLFADVVHRKGVEAELKTSGLPFVHEGEPPSGRGVVLYRYPSHKDPVSMTLEGEGHTQTIWERPWAAWIKRCLADRAVDVVHIVTEACFSGLQPVLEITATPWEAPQPVARKWLLLSQSRVQLRYVDALLASDLATGLGAWGIVFGAPNSDSRRPQRALMHQASGLFPGVFAVHDLSQDSAATACADLYRFLTGPAESDAGTPFIPDRPELVLQCHPAILQAQLNNDRIKETFGEDFAHAVQLLKAQMQKRGSVPAWAAALQRQIELSASTLLSSNPLTERDKAARSGVTNALTVAMVSLAMRMKSDE